MEMKIVLKRPAVKSSLLDARLHSGEKEDFIVWGKIIVADFEREKSYLSMTKSYSQDKVAEMELEFKKYMFLSSKYKDLKLPMSRGVDDFWHTAILNTRNYQTFCEEVLGRFIHHMPTISDEENWSLMPEYLKNTIPLYSKHFGACPDQYWKTGSHKESCCIC